MVVTCDIRLFISCTCLLIEQLIIELVSFLEVETIQDWTFVFKYLQMIAGNNFLFRLSCFHHTLMRLFLWLNNVVLT